MLLIGLHIIQKTPQVQTFTFATFEHVNNEKNGFQFNNIIPTPGDGYIPRGLRTAIRQHSIPAELQAFNTAVQNQLKAQFGNDIVWANYQLVGIQVKPTNRPTDANSNSPAFQQYFLANLATRIKQRAAIFPGSKKSKSGRIPAAGWDKYISTEGGRRVQQVLHRGVPRMSRRRPDRRWRFQLPEFRKGPATRRFRIRSFPIRVDRFCLRTRRASRTARAPWLCFRSRSNRQPAGRLETGIRKLRSAPCVAESSGIHLTGTSAISKRRTSEWPTRQPR